MATGTAGATAAPARARWRARPRTRKTILVIHLIAALGLLGEVWTLVTLNLYSILTSDEELARSAYELMGVLVFAGGIPLSMLALITGILVGLTTHWGVLRHYWVFATLLLLIGVISVGMFAFNPEAMAAAAEAGSLSSGQQWGQFTAVAAQLVMLITATALSVFKPRGRISWRRAQPVGNGTSMGQP